MAKKIGCSMKRGFSTAGFSGREISVMSTLKNKGYKELYYEAPYNWALINPKTKKIFVYSEGDTTEISCPNKLALFKNAKSHIDFMNKMGYDSSTKEGEKIIKQMKFL